MELSNVDASRLLFGLTAAYHFLFVPLTIGLIALIAVLEGISLCTGQVVFRDAARFFSWPFLVNFICGVLTGYPLRHQVEVNWAAYSQVAAQVFSRVFSLEGGIAPVMVALVAVFAMGWRLKPLWHWLASSILAVVLIVQSAGILMVNAWMQKPVETHFASGQAQVTDFALLLSNPLFLPKLLHTMSGAWVLGGMFAVSISAMYLLGHRHRDLAHASFRVASRFTLFALVIAGAAGHWSGERLVTHQPMKFAAIEAIWEIDERGPDLVLFAWPDQANQTNRHEVAVRGSLRWIVSADLASFPSLKQQTAEIADLIRRDLKNAAQPEGQPRLGYLGLLDQASAKAGRTDSEIMQAARRAVPNVALVFWSFRVMLGCWATMLLLMLAVNLRAPDPARRTGRLMLMACAASMALPWVATEAGWIVCEAGRQPWTITGMLATRASLGAVTATHAIEYLRLAVPVGALLLAVNITSLIVHFRRGPGRSAEERERPVIALSPTFPAQ